MRWPQRQLSFIGLDVFVQGTVAYGVNIMVQEPVRNALCSVGYPTYPFSGLQHNVGVGTELVEYVGKIHITYLARGAWPNVKLGSGWA